MSDKISEKLHPIPSAIANQRRISIRNIIIYWKPNFVQIGRFVYLVTILHLNYITGNETILLFCYDDDNRINVKKNPEMMNKSDNKKIL